MSLISSVEARHGVRSQMRDRFFQRFRPTQTTDGTTQTPSKPVYTMEPVKDLTAEQVKKTRLFYGAVDESDEAKMRVALHLLRYVFNGQKVDMNELDTLIKKQLRGEARARALSYVENQERKVPVDIILGDYLGELYEAYSERNLKEPILFAGCGSAYASQVLQEHARKEGQTDLKTYGVDVSPSMLSIAREKKVESPLFELDLSKPLPFVDNSFGGIVCESALSHIELKKLPTTLRELNRILRPGGVATLHFRFLGQLETAGVYSTEEPDDGKRYYDALPQSQVEKLVSAAGFNILHDRTRTNAHPINSQYPSFLHLLVEKAA